MLDMHYSKVSPILNAELHSGRDMKKEPVTKPEIDTNHVSALAFEMLVAGTLDETGLLAVIGVGTGRFTASDDIRMMALTAKRDDLISQDTLMRILNG